MRSRQGPEFLQQSCLLQCPDNPNLGAPSYRKKFRKVNWNSSVGVLVTISVETSKNDFAGVAPTDMSTAPGATRVLLCHHPCFLSLMSPPLDYEAFTQYVQWIKKNNPGVVHWAVTQTLLVRFWRSQEPDHSSRPCPGSFSLYPMYCLCFWISQRKTVATIWRLEAGLG